jgi:hypothetical protein
MTWLCKYAPYFTPYLGKAGEKTGLRKYRINGVALLDTTTVLIAGVIISYVFKQSIILVLLILFLLGVLSHRLFGTRTTVDRFFFPDPSYDVCK